MSCSRTHCSDVSEAQNRGPYKGTVLSAPSYVSERVSVCLMSHQQLRSYGDRDQTRDPWVQGEWVIHYTMAAPLKLL